MTTDRLRSELVALAEAVRPAGVRLMLTGGFALILREAIRDPGQVEARIQPFSWSLEGDCPRSQPGAVACLR